MTAHEASELFLDYLNIYSQFMFGYIGVLSAFLVMSFAAADRLNKVLSALVLTLFSLVCIMLIAQMNLLRNDLNGIYLYMLDLKDNNPSALVWFGTNPAWVVAMLTIVTNLVSFGGFAGCTAFYFYQRRTRFSDEGT